MSLWVFASTTRKKRRIEGVLLNLAEQARKEEGNLEYNVHQESDGTFFLYEIWRSQDDFNKHINHPLVQEFMNNRMSYLEKDVEGHFGTMLTDYAVACVE